MLMRQYNRVGVLQQGFTLIEVMISLFILSVGMLGTSAMLLQGQREAANTSSETLAIEIASNIAERMRANIVGVDGGNYNVFTSAGATTFVSCINTVGCSAAQKAEFDAYMTNQEIKYLFSDSANGVATVNRIGVSPVFQIEINWDEAVRDSDTTGLIKPRNYTMIFEP